MFRQFGSAYRCALPRLALLLTFLSLAVDAAIPDAHVEAAMRSVLAGAVQPGVELWDIARWREPLLRVYEKRSFAPLWFSGKDLSPAGSGLLQELQEAESRGLRPEDYDGAHLASLAGALATNRAAGPEQVASLDVAFSVTAARIAMDLHAGRVAPSEVGFDLEVPQAALDVGQVVESLAAAASLSAALDRLEPQLLHYGLLKSALAKYRETSDDSAESALRIQRIVLSLERVRWLPSKLESPPIIVNIPQFRLFAFRTTQDVAREIMQMDVIVGSKFPGRETPVFAANMRYVVLNPYWDVPYSIMKKELLPSIRSKPDWLERNDYEIVKGQTDNAAPQSPTPENIELLSRGILRVRQKPGPNNALGRVKFMLPNRYNVYLHDTPARALFSKAQRAFSHGCIRVADPMGLLKHVLRDDPSWTQTRIDAALRAGKPVRIPLTRPVPVFILYGTALATENGETLFFEDIYRHDARLDTLLTSRRIEARSVSRGMP